MYAVIFEVWPNRNGKEEYLNIASQLKLFLEEQKGFISIERFQSLTNQDKLLSLSFWEDEGAITIWRNLLEHRIAQKKGRNELFDDYRIRVSEVVRDYSMSQRNEIPEDSKDINV
ncbi:Antibiotic biosynthesis monooxygenase [Arcobacter nitrofigilis DSM 7299]|uniref:Antibiotic biosynthesis monooxygenase n=1 Tax=Arcobacter nitrofigilis (strain ATCC 33309 / DSM 7299 / CCUG 15893 / LMG 7604 / NCTC 12251 / CI) TaxID=572480 RepID=D5V7U7_ARCNC|nr:antibiotic biosynthesis monooxygenase [Arcobacter nitrofigilis]ADG94717.1 Antibiotic biosynthesis monooxygenase [Arcobacter nitrofigilis DSM 7299]